MPANRQLRQIVVVGAGVAGMGAAEALRRDGYDGALTIVGAERHAPYHRPPLSKKLLSGQVHRAGIDMAPQFDMDARVLRGATAVGLDMSARSVQVRDTGQNLSLSFDGLVIASGAVAVVDGAHGELARCGHSHPPAAGMGDGALLHDSAAPAVSGSRPRSAGLYPIGGSGRLHDALVHAVDAGLCPAECFGRHSARHALIGWRGSMCSGRIAAPGDYGG